MPRGLHSSRQQHQPDVVGACWGLCWVLQEVPWEARCWEAPSPVPCLGECVLQQGGPRARSTAVVWRSRAWLLVMVPPKGQLAQAACYVMRCWHRRQALMAGELLCGICRRLEPGAASTLGCRMCCRRGGGGGHGYGSGGGYMAPPPPVYGGDSTTIVNNYYINEDNTGDNVYQVRPGPKCSSSMVHARGGTRLPAWLCMAWQAWWSFRRPAFVGCYCPL